MNVDDIVRERIEAARRKAAEQKRIREELAAARQKGLAKRHAQKLRRLAEKGSELAPPLDLSNETLAASGAL
ncbi:hypothetical protein ACIPIC_18375 [Streptomyces collinus]|uniref:hypothetical protein n=1 Tax=Streptomyces collinus TaxID=42684 RepID=UPI0037F78FD9